MTNSIQKGKRNEHCKTGIEVRIPILNDEYKVIVVFGGYKEIRTTLLAYHYPEDLDLNNVLVGMRGRTFCRSGCFPVIALPEKPRTAEEIATLAHEAVHAVNHVFDSIGETSRDEAYAHSIGAVVRIVLEGCRGKIND